MASQDWLEKDFYQILGVSKDVSDAELKKTFRKLARKHHPDSNPGDAKAEAKFKEISEAYDVLSDPQQREEYDQIRAMGAGGARFTSGGQGFEDMFGGFGHQGGQHFSFQGAPGGFDDLFGGMFGGAPRGPQRGRDIATSTVLDLETAVAGTTITLRSSSRESTKVRIPAGVKDGQKIKIRGKGEPSPDGGPPGDIILTVSVRKHPVYRREDNNLRLTVPITFTEAVLGATIEVPMLGGGSVKLRVQPGTPSGRVLRVKGRGVKTTKATGDLLAEVQVAVPAHLSDAQRKALDAWQAVEPDEDPRADLKSRVG